MHILYYHLYFHTRDNASGTRSYEMAKRLIEQGHKVTIVCGSEEGKIKFDGQVHNGYKYGMIEGINIIEIQTPPYNYANFLQRGFAFLRFGLRGIRLAFKLDYDLLFATSTPLTASIPGIIMKWFRKKPFVFEVRDLWPDLPRAMGVIKNPVVLWAISFLEWLSYRKADACIGLSPGIVEGIKKRSRKDLPVAMIPNGSDIDVFSPGRREELNIDGISETELAAVFTGAHGIANGLDNVLDAAACLKRMNRNTIKLIFIGDGQMKEHLLRRVREERLDNCIFLDPVPKKELNKITGSADLGMMVLANVPAFYYGTSPNKFFDYLASGLPVINNYPGWIADLITENHCGKPVRPDDPEAFAGMLMWFDDHRDVLQEMSNNARTLAEKRFNRDLLAADFIACLENTAAVYYAKSEQYSQTK